MSRPARGLGLACLIVLVALNLRAFFTASSPLLGDIRAATGLGFQGASLLTVLPMLAMGATSLFGVAPAHRLGERRGIALGLGAIALACASRYATRAGVPLLLASAALAGVGVGLVQALMPGVVKHRYPARMGMAMGLYSAALMFGGGLGAMASPWVARVSGDWRAGLAVWCVPAAVALAAWARTPQQAAGPSAARNAGVATPSAGPARVGQAGDSHPAGASAPHRPPWLRCFASRRAWLLAVYFGLINGGYTSLAAWLPQFYAQQGWDAQRAGAMLALMTAAQVAAALAVPVLARGHRDLRPWLAATLLAQLAGFAGLALQAPGAVAIVALLGFGLGGAFALCMVLALDHLPEPRQAGMLAAFMQGLGFMIAALAPFVTGWVREHSGGFGFVWAYLGAIVVVLLPMTLRFAPQRYARAVGGLFGAAPPAAAAAVAAVAVD